MKLKSFGEAWVCNLYSITTNQAAIIALFRVVNHYVGNLAPMPGVFPDYPAPVVRNAGETGSGVRFHGHPIAVRLPRVARFHMRRRAPLQPIRATSCQASKRERAQSSPNSIKLKPSLLAKQSS